MGLRDWRDWLIGHSEELEEAAAESGRIAKRSRETEREMEALAKKQADIARRLRILATEAELRRHE
jgi:hypothetical protein